MLPFKVEKMQSRASTLPVKKKCEIKNEQSTPYNNNNEGSDLIANEALCDVISYQKVKPDGIETGK
jgi:hypothetical protein